MEVAAAEEVVEEAAEGAVEEAAEEAAEGAVEEAAEGAVEAAREEVTTTTIATSATTLSAARPLCDRSRDHWLDSARSSNPSLSSQKSISIGILSNQLINLFDNSLVGFETRICPTYCTILCPK